MDKVANILAVAIAEAVREAVRSELEPIKDQLESISVLLGYAKSENPKLAALTEPAPTIKLVVNSNDGDETETEVSEVWALSSCKEFYIPFNAEIHGQTKDDDKNDIPKVNTNGDFAKKRGVQPGDFNKIEGAWIDQYGKSVKDYSLDENGIPVEAVVPSLKPAVPAKSGKPIPPTKPTVPVKPASPTKPAAQKKDEEKQEILNLINKLTGFWNVDYDLVIETVFPEGAEQFSDVTTADYADIKSKATVWLDNLDAAQACIDALKQLQADNAERCANEGINLEEDVNTFMGTYNSKTLGGLAPANVEDLINDLSNFHSQYDEYLAG